MMSLATAAPTVGAAFVAASVEAVEAFTIVLAVSVVRGVRPAALGAGAALAVLAAAVALLGPLIALAPVRGLQLVIGLLLLVFGLGWLRKAVLRAGGVLALHDETAAFAEETQSLRAAGDHTRSAADWIAGMAAFKAVLLEGTEVVFIVLAVGARPGLLGPAAIGAAAACLIVFAAGLMIRAPLARIPENSLKFVVGAILTGFGVFWCCEGLGAPPPGGDLAIPALIAVYLAAGLAMAAWVRRARAAPRVAGAA
jgi:Ca2+/H+ antiporter, TMEM165/GDT1 family